MTSHAETAKAIRQELKVVFPMIKFEVRSECFSMGDAVRIHYTNGVPQKDIEKVVNKYEYGSFNAMEDIYENDNRREDIPQVKYITISREISKDVKDLIKKDIAVKWGIIDIEDQQEWYDKRGMWSDQAIWKELQDINLLTYK